MKVLLDTCVWGGVLKELADAGYDVVWAGNWPEDPGDEEILSRAYNEGRILVTLDKDFGELAVARGMPHCGILRLVNFSARLQAVVCMRVLSIKAEELRSGAIITAEPGRLRIRPPDSREYDVT
jgi:predicted nuclease of predicted toxin-antitoxin system